MVLENSRGWMTPSNQYLTQEKLPDEEIEAQRIKRISSLYLMVDDHRYKMGRSFPMLRFIAEEEVGLIMKKVHEGVCGSHIGGRALFGKILMVGYYWLSMLQRCAWFVNSCEKCHIYAPFIHSLAELLHSVISLWPFYQWGSNILGPCPLTARQLKFLIVAVDYFIKWMEVKVVS